MSKTVEFYFDFVSPTSYLAWTQLPRIALENNAEIIWKPVLLGSLFKSTGNQSPVALPAKARYMLQDLARFAQRYAVPLAANPFFPINTRQLLCGAIGYLVTNEFPRYMKAIFEGIWTQRLNLGDPEQTSAVLSQARLDLSAYKRFIDDESVIQQLEANTQEAVARGAFGVPTFFVGKQMLFGQDRLDFVAEALQK